MEKVLVYGAMTVSNKIDSRASDYARRNRQSKHENLSNNSAANHFLVPPVFDVLKMQSVGRRCSSCGLNPLASGYTDRTGPSHVKSRVLG